MNPSTLALVAAAIATGAGLALVGYQLGRASRTIDEYRAWSRGYQCAHDDMSAGAEACQN